MYTCIYPKSGSCCLFFFTFSCFVECVAIARDSFTAGSFWYGQPTPEYIPELRNLYYLRDALTNLAECRVRLQQASLDMWYPRPWLPPAPGVYPEATKTYAFLRWGFLASGRAPGPQAQGTPNLVRDLEASCSACDRYYPIPCRRETGKHAGYFAAALNFPWLRPLRPSFHSLITCNLSGQRGQCP